MISWDAVLFLIPYLVSLTICLVVGWEAWRKRPLAGAGCFAGAAWLEAEWIGAYLGQMLSPNLEAKLAWNDAQFLGAVLVPLFYLCFALEYSRSFQRRSRWLGLFTSLIPAALLAMIWTDASRHWFRVSPHLEAGEPFAVLVWNTGPAFNLYSAYVYALMVLTVLVLGAQFLSAPRIYHVQVGALLVGVLVPYLTTIFTALQWVDFRLHDVTPLAFGVSNLVIAWALLRGHLLEIFPMAHEQVLENLSDGLFVLDPQLRVVDFNLTAQRMLCDTQDLTPGQPVDACLPGLREAILSGVEQIHFELRRTVAERERIFEVSAVILRSGSKKSSGWLVTVRDITEHKRATDALLTTLALLNATIESTAEAILVLDASQKVLACNRQFFQLWKFSEDWRSLAAEERLAQMAAPLKDPQSFTQAFLRLMEKLDWQDVAELELRDGRILEMSARPYHIEDRPVGRLFTFQDITLRHQTEEELRWLAVTDPLTGLFNRRHFFFLAEVEAERARRYHSPLSIIIFDLDNFKRVNDTYGHQVGDKVLHQIATVCAENLRSPDVIARYGGEEFVVLLPETDIESAVRTAERLRCLVEECYVDTPFGAVHLTISLGAACQGPEETIDLDSLLECADKALYLAKRSGRNQTAVWNGPPCAEA